jgi:hypothetical protein
MTNDDDRYFVDAYINYSDVAALTTGYRVDLEFGENAGTQQRLLPTIQIQDIVPYRQFQDDEGNALVKVHLQLADNNLQTMVGKAVRVRFVTEGSLVAALTAPFSETVINSLKFFLGRGK